MRYLGIDFGERRIGVAIGDEERSVTRALTTLQRKSDKSAIDEILEIARREGAGGLVVGEPLRLDGTRGEAAARVLGFAAKLAQAAEIPVHLADESLTSREAERRLRRSGAGRRRRKETLDATAAQILLEDWLATRRQ